MKKLPLLLILGMLGTFFNPQVNFAQNINTDTTSTTIGSTQFGVVLSETDLATVMQSSIALSCAGPVDARVCTPAGNGTSTAFVRVDALPGSFTDSPTRTVSTNPNFACGPTAAANDCRLNMGFGPASVSNGRVAQTAPDFDGRQAVGLIDTDVVVGDGGQTPGMPDGFIRFTMDPTDGTATIDQLITHSIDLGGSNLMVFTQRDATIGSGNLIPDLAMTDPGNNPLTLVSFTAFDTRTSTLPATGMVNRMILAQGAADGFGALDFDVQLEFPGVGAGANDPALGGFVTPGLNTGIGPDGFSFP